jgi:hypothetical protein
VSEGSGQNVFAVLKGDSSPRRSPSTSWVASRAPRHAAGRELGYTVREDVIPREQLT